MGFKLVQKNAPKLFFFVGFKVLLVQGELKFSDMEVWVLSLAHLTSASTATSTQPIIV